MDEAYPKKHRVIPDQYTINEQSLQLRVQTMFTLAERTSDILLVKLCIDNLKENLPDRPESTSSFSSMLHKLVDDLELADGEAEQRNQDPTDDMEIGPIDAGIIKIISKAMNRAHIHIKFWQLQQFLTALLIQDVGPHSTVENMVRKVTQAKVVVLSKPSTISAGDGNKSVNSLIQLFGKPLQYSLKYVETYLEKLYEAVGHHTSRDDTPTILLRMADKNNFETLVDDIRELNAPSADYCRLLVRDAIQPLRRLGELVTGMNKMSSSSLSLHETPPEEAPDPRTHGSASSH